MHALVNDPRTVDQTFGFLLSLALDNFALSSIFKSLRSSDAIDISDFKSLLGTIMQPRAYLLIFELFPDIPAADTFLSGKIFLIFEHLIGLNHRNKVLLSSMPLFSPILQTYLRPDEAAMQFRPCLQKILKRLVDVGVLITDARLLFQRAVKDDGTLEMDVLEIIRSGMKAKWPSHLSMEGSSSLEIKDENVKGLPPSGFTFMVLHSLLLLFRQHPDLQTDLALD